MRLVTSIGPHCQPGWNLEPHVSLVGSKAHSLSIMFLFPFKNEAKNKNAY